MPPTLSRPSSAAPTSLVYITIGALLTVWSGIWFFYMSSNPTTNNAIRFICAGVLLTGIVLLGIGFALGPLARMARSAEQSPEEAAPATNRESSNVTMTRNT